MIWWWWMPDRFQSAGTAGYQLPDQALIPPPVGRPLLRKPITGPDPAE